MTFDLEKARKIVGAMSPTPWIVLEDRYGQIDVIRNPNHPMHKEGVIELWGRASETATPDAIGISYMRSEFPNALDEIERLRGEMENYGDDYVCQMKSKDARIQELEADNQNLVTLNKSLMNNDWILRDNNRKYRKRAQKAELLNKELKSKIGPDAETGNRDHVVGPDQMVPCWQITEDRVTAIDQGLRFLEWSNAKTGNVETKKRIAILKTMLEEASDEHGFER